MISSAARRPWLRIYVPLVCYFLFMFVPFYWMILTSFKADHELLTTPNPWWIFHPTLKHVLNLLAGSQYLHWFANTLFVSAGATALSVAISFLAAYAIVRLRFPGAPALSAAIFFAYLVPPAILFLPLANVLIALHWFDKLWALIPIYATFLVPFCTWLLSGFLRTLPRELEEAGRVDGASHVQIMTRIVLPLATPGLISSIIFCFTLSWNEYLYALVYMFSSANKTISVGLTTELIRGDVFQWGQLMAGALLGTLPVIVVYFFFVEHYVSGIAGALKD